MNHFVTIATTSHLYKVYALADSLNQPGIDFTLHVLVVDGAAEYSFPHCQFYQLADIAQAASAAAIISKYKNKPDKLRWSLKPVMMKYLLTQGNIDKIIYLDNDLFFYSDYSFLFGLLNAHSFLLTPHYYKINPDEEQNWLEANFRVGLFNAGFAGANKSALESLQWWADCCLYRCEKNAFRGLFDDQKYLNLMPVREPGAHIVRHRGCNVAGWNKELCRRETANNEVLINGTYPLVFIHYNDTTVREIAEGRDAALKPYYNKYLQALKKHKARFSASDIYFQLPVTHRIKLGVWKVITAIGI